MGFVTNYFAQKCPQNAGNAVSETQMSNNFRGACPRTRLQLCRHYSLPLTKILATPLLVTLSPISLSLFLDHPRIAGGLKAMKNQFDSVQTIYIRLAIKVQSNSAINGAISFLIEQIDGRTNEDSLTKTNSQSHRG